MIRVRIVTIDRDADGETCETSEDITLTPDGWGVTWLYTDGSSTHFSVTPIHGEG